MAQPVVTAAEMRAIEAQAVARGDSWEGLMDRAGEAVARLALNWAGEQGLGRRVLVLAGPGNNGGDALVAARCLAEAGCEVRCRSWRRRAEGDDRLRNLLTLRGIGVEPLQGRQASEDLLPDLEWSAWVVDGLLGTGLQRDVEGDLAVLIEGLNGVGRPVVAIDLPSGVDSDTGRRRGTSILARFTVATGLLKYAHLLPPGSVACGETALGEIGLDPQVSSEKASGRVLDAGLVRELLPERPADAHKGTFGRVMVVAGSVNYIGAAALATQGALRSGAGLVTLACAGDILPMVASKLTEATFLVLPSDLGAISSHAADKVRAAVNQYEALVIGCGLGQDKETVAFMRQLLLAPKIVTGPPARPIGFAARLKEPKKEEPEHKPFPPAVIDGDALNILAAWEEWHTHIPRNAVLTPHPGEMARLLGSTVEEVQSDRISAARTIAEKAGCVVVLKGAGTVVVEPGGKLFVSRFANPALATAGSGDVLAGAIGGFLAQGLDPVQAACIGVYLHGAAGELLRDRYGPAGGLAGELPVLLAISQRAVREGAGA